MTGPPRMSRDDDGRLRRLHFFEQCGARLAPALAQIKAELRAKDLRRTVREPFEAPLTVAGWP